MKFNKEIAIILVLLSLLISAVGVSFYFYKKNQNIIKSKNEMVTIYIAKQDLKRDILIKEEHLKATQMARQYILNKPLSKKAIVGKFAKEAIFKNEIFIKEKLASKVGEAAEETLMAFKHNSYNMAFELFKNPNYSLKPSDTINIVSVYPESFAAFQKKQSNDVKVSYVSKNIKVLGFMRDGHSTLKTIIKKKVKKIVKKKEVEQLLEIKADEIVLDISDKDLLSLIRDYNKGKQLWMIKTKVKPKAKPVVKKEEKTAVKKVTKKPKKRVYVHKLYVPKNIAIKKTAVIEYINKEIPTQKSSGVLRTNLKAQCEATNQFLIGSSRKVYLREKPSVRSKLVKRVYRNYIIPYKTKVNKDWYEVCDGSFVHKNEAVKISKKRVEAILHGKKK